MKAETKNMFKGETGKVPYSALDGARNSLDAALDEGKTPEEFAAERLQSPVAMRSIYRQMQTDDRTRSDNRAKVQAMVEYKEPYPQAVLDKLGRGSQFNVNFGEGAATVNDSVNNYLDIFTNPTSLAALPIKLDHGTVMDRVTWQEIVSEEFTKMVRLWDESQFSFLELVNQFVIQGVSFSSFRSGDDWRWSVGGLNEYFVPARSKATSSSFEIIISEELIAPTKLFAYIRDSAKAKAEGWDEEQVRYAVAASAKRGDNKYDEQSPEQIEEQIKAHDFDTASPTAPIKILHARVQEYDGSVSQYICAEVNADGGEEPLEDKWLFKKTKAYDNMKEAVQVFPFFTGNNGNIHTIRGLGHIIFPQVQASNLMQCKMLDSASESMSTTYISNSETNLDTLPIINAGTARLISSSLQIAETQHTPDLSRTAVPAMNLLQNQISRMSSSTAMSDVLTKGQDRRSKFEVSAAIEYFSAINAAAMRLFFKPWRELLVTSAKRAFTGKASTSDWGKAAATMRQNCIDRGVPEEVVTGGINFDQAMVDLPLGLGNKAAKQAIFDRGSELLPYMDDAGRKRFAAIKSTDLFGEELGRYLVPTEGVDRPPIDKKIAEMENNQLSNGMTITVNSGEDFMVHLREHIQFLWQYQEAVEQGQIELVDAVPKMLPVYDHVVETFSVAQVPDESDAELNNAKQSIQQLGEIISNGLKAIQKLEREQQLQADESAQTEEAEKEDPAMVKAHADAEIKLKQSELDRQLKTLEHEQKIAFQNQENQHNLDMQTMKAAQARELADLEKASSIGREIT